MAKIPYLVRRKNIFYFRLAIPAELRGSVNAREIIQSLKTENREEATHLALKLAAHFKASLYELKTGKAQQINHLALPEPQIAPSIAPPVLLSVQVKSSAPLLSVVIADFLKRYDHEKRRAKLSRVLGKRALKSFHPRLFNVRFFAGESWSVTNGRYCRNQTASSYRERDDQFSGYRL